MQGGDESSHRSAPTLMDAGEGSGSGEGFRAMPTMMDGAGNAPGGGEGFRAEDMAVTMADVLNDLAPERPELTLELGGARGMRLIGTLERAGLDRIVEYDRGTGRAEVENPVLAHVII